MRGKLPSPFHPRRIKKIFFEAHLRLAISKMLSVKFVKGVGQIRRQQARMLLLEEVRIEYGVSRESRARDDRRRGGRKIRAENSVPFPKAPTFGCRPLQDAGRTYPETRHAGALRRLAVLEKSHTEILAGFILSAAGLQEPQKLLRRLDTLLRVCFVAETSGEDHVREAAPDLVRKTSPFCGCHAASCLLAHLADFCHLGQLLGVLLLPLLYSVNVGFDFLPVGLFKGLAEQSGRANDEGIVGRPRLGAEYSLF